MAKDDPHFRLRIPPQLKGAVEEAASDAQRSINAEIVHRLYFSFDAEEERRELMAKLAELKAQNETLRAVQDENARLQKRLENEMTDSARAAASWEEWATRQFTDENTLYVLLDADGHPQSWDEIVTHLQAISDACGGKVERIEAGVFDAPRESNDRRFEHWMKLREFYRAKRQASERDSD